jgi:hypothetical protein
LGVTLDIVIIPNLLKDGPAESRPGLPFCLIASETTCSRWLSAL